MSGIGAVDSSRSLIIRVLATTALLTLHSLGTVGMTGALTLAGVSSATAQRGYSRGRGRGVRRGTATKKSSKKGGRRGWSNKGSSINVRDTPWSGSDMRDSGRSGGARVEPASARSGPDVRRSQSGGGAGTAAGRRGGATAAAIERCAEQYRSYDRETMMYTDFDGRKQSCP